MKKLHTNDQSYPHEPPQIKENNHTQNVYIRPWSLVEHMCDVYIRPWLLQLKLCGCVRNKHGVIAGRGTYGRIYTSMAPKGLKCI